MKTLMITVFSCLLAAGLYAQDDLNGAWKADWSTPDGAQTFTVTLTINGNAYMVDMESDGAIEIKGEMTVNGNEVSLTDNQEFENACPVAGKYTYAIEDGVMTMTLVEDACEGRSVMLPMMKFKK